MHWLLYVRLTLLTAGTLLPFFWMIVILGHRRQRNFERIFFFLCLALTFFFGSSLLALNAGLYYDAVPGGLERFAWTFLCLGLWFIPPLVIHLHIEYANLRELLRPGRSYRVGILTAYAPAILFSFSLFTALQIVGRPNFERPTLVLGAFFRAYLIGAILLAVYWQHRFADVAPDAPQKSFHRTLQAGFAGLAFFLFVEFLAPRFFSALLGQSIAAAMFILVLLPFCLLISNVERFNFLQIGRQRNLI